MERRAPVIRDNRKDLNPISLTVSLLILSACYAIETQELPLGKAIDVVTCQADRNQSYALYIPSGYSPDRQWPLLLAFDARALGDVPVKRYQEAAEKFGYIVAGSNNSRNGPVGPEYVAAQAMEADVTARFSVDPRRIYVAGQSGGARLAFDLALQAKGRIAGVIASSAGLPPSMGIDLELPFVVYGTAGTEDFNYLELTRLDRTVATPHRVRIFPGGHTWLPGELAMEALEWMEVQAMRTGTRPRNEAMIDRMFARHTKELSDAPGKAEAYYVNYSIATAFEGLKDVSPYVQAEERMANDASVVAAVRSQVSADLAENQMGVRMRNLIDQLGSPSERTYSLDELRTILTRLATEAHAPEDSKVRQRARRILNDTISYNNARPGGRQDAEYMKLLDALKP
jgi:pimeloyl-ACP methyl ester carboxylesterase